MKPRSCLALALATGLAATAAALPVHPERADPTDLEITGHFPALAGAERGYVRWADLRALPTVEPVQEEVEWLTGPRPVLVLPLTAVWDALGRAAEADLLVADCADGYQSNFPAEFVATHQPFLLLEIEGRAPPEWPRGELTFWPGPYMISVTTRTSPRIATWLHASNKRPFAVVRLQARHLRTWAAPLFAGALEQPTPLVADGRELFLRNCLSCHSLTPDAGGRMSERNLSLLRIFAVSAPDYFNGYVRNPRTVRPDSRMPGHPDYTPHQIDALRAFLAATPAPAP